MVGRAVQIMKKLLRTVSEKASFKYEELLTILDNEAVINSRPLTDLSENPMVCLLLQCLLKIFKQQVFQICTTWVTSTALTGSSTCGNRQKTVLETSTQVFYFNNREKRHSWRSRWGCSWCSPDWMRQQEDGLANGVCCGPFSWEWQLYQGDESKHSPCRTDQTCSMHLYIADDKCHELWHYVHM